MIVDYLKNSYLYTCFGPNFKKAFSLLETAQLQSPNGNQIINQDLYYFVQEYFGKDKEECHLESHKRYIDLQYVAKGTEIVDYLPLNDVLEIMTKYNEEKDIMFFKGKPSGVVLKEGMFMILFPEDTHAPKIAVNDLLIKKVVVKIKI